VFLEKKNDVRRLRGVGAWGGDELHLLFESNIERGSKPVACI